MHNHRCRGTHHPSFVRNPRPRDFRFRCRLTGSLGTIVESSAHAPDGLSGFKMPSMLPELCHLSRIGDQRFPTTWGILPGGQNGRYLIGGTVDKSPAHYSAPTPRTAPVSHHHPTKTPTIDLSNFSFSSIKHKSVALYSVFLRVFLHPSSLH